MCKRDMEHEKIIPGDTTDRTTWNRAFKHILMSPLQMMGKVWDEDHTCRPLIEKSPMATDLQGSEVSPISCLQAKQ